MIKRGTGLTSEQMKQASRDAIFIWCNNNLWYPKELARFVGRFDITIVPPSWLEGNAWRGLRREIIIDHAAELTNAQWDAWRFIRETIK